MSKYKYDGEHYRVVIEGIAFVKGEETTLLDDDEKILLNSGFGKAMLENGELTKLDEQAPKKPKSPKSKPSGEESSGQVNSEGEPVEEELSAPEEPRPLK